MTRVDICYDDLSGIYVDNKWVPVGSIDVSNVEHHGEKVYEFGIADPIEILPARTEWMVRIEMKSPTTGPNINMTFHDPEMHMWSKRQEYIYNHEMYVIEEMYP